MEPLVSVVMSVYNGEAFLAESIGSIINQSYKQFEFIIVDDASTDASADIIHGFDDSRIIYIKNETNLGLAASLNIGIKKAGGKYIARMDDDDISMPERLEEQVRFMGLHPDVGLLGTYAELFGDDNGVRTHSQNSHELKIRSLFSCQFCHPTVMIRRSVLTDNNLWYNEQLNTAQDYDLWTRMIPFTNFSTLEEPLLRYRLHSNRVSELKRTDQLRNTEQVHFNILTQLGLRPNSKELAHHASLATFEHRMSIENIKRSEKYLSKIVSYNETTHFFEHQELYNFMSEYFYNICKKSPGNRFVKCYIFSRSSLSKNKAIRLKRMKIFFS